MMLVQRSILPLLGCLVLLPMLAFQSQRRPRESAFGAGVTVALYYYDRAKSKPVEPEIHLPMTFSEAEQEHAYLTNHLGLEELGLRQLISVGLKNGEKYATAEKFGSDLLHTTISVHSATRGKARIALTIRYGSKVLLDTPDVPMENFETVALSGGEAMFGLKNFAGPQGPESVPAIRALLVTVTVQVDAENRLQNKPYDLSHVVDEFGAPAEIGQGALFMPPAVLTRVAPVLPPSRRIPSGVLLEGVVTLEGRIINIRVLRSVDPELDKIAVDALRRFDFRPGMVNDKPVYSTFRQEINFVVPETAAPPGRRSG